MNRLETSTFSSIGFVTWLARAIRSDTLSGVVALAVVALSAASAVGQSLPPGASLFGLDEAHKPKDFSIIREGDWYPCFYIMTDGSLASETQLGHSRSRNLYAWQFVGVALSTSPLRW